jgi:hypothetical protein
VQTEKLQLLMHLHPRSCRYCRQHEAQRRKEKQLGLLPAAVV